MADQIGHLAYFDHTASVAITDAKQFKGLVAALWHHDGDEAVHMDDLTLGAYRKMTPTVLLASWRTARAELAGASSTLNNHTRVDWYGPSMGSKSFLTARLMECWAHGQDVIDAVGGSRPPTNRLRHIAQLGYITRAWTYANRGLDIPETPVRVDLISPSEGSWQFGPDDAPERVTGPAEEFCLVVVQRRHLDDTNLAATPLAREWLLMAQAFAGPSTTGPAPGTRTGRGSDHSTNR